MKFTYEWNARMDFSKSMTNPNSRTIKILTYLNANGSATKDALVYKALERKTPFKRGYSSLYFAMLKRNGLVNLTRYGNEFVYTITELGRSFVTGNAPSVESARPTYVKWTYPYGAGGPAVAVEVKGVQRGEIVNGMRIEFEEAK